MGKTPFRALLHPKTGLALKHKAVVVLTHITDAFQIGSIMRNMGVKHDEMVKAGGAIVGSEPVPITHEDWNVKAVSAVEYKYDALQCWP